MEEKEKETPYGQDHPGQNFEAEGPNHVIWNLETEEET